jgi:hypothetical protein
LIDLRNIIPRIPRKYRTTLEDWVASAESGVTVGRDRSASHKGFPAASARWLAVAAAVGLAAVITSAMTAHAGRTRPAIRYLEGRFGQHCFVLRFALRISIRAWNVLIKRKANMKLRRRNTIPEPIRKETSNPIP